MSGPPPFPGTLRLTPREQEAGPGRAGRGPARHASSGLGAGRGSRASVGSALLPTVFWDASLPSQPPPKTGARAQLAGFKQRAPPVQQRSPAPRAPPASAPCAPGPPAPSRRSCCPERLRWPWWPPRPSSPAQPKKNLSLHWAGWGAGVHGRWGCRVPGGSWWGGLGAWRRPGRRHPAPTPASRRGSRCSPSAGDVRTANKVMRPRKALIPGLHGRAPRWVLGGARARRGPGQGPTGAGALEAATGGPGRAGRPGPAGGLAMARGQGPGGGACVPVPLAAPPALTEAVPGAGRRDPDQADEHTEDLPKSGRQDAPPCWWTRSSR